MQVFTQDKRQEENENDMYIQRTGTMIVGNVEKGFEVRLVLRSIWKSMSMMKRSRVIHVLNVVKVTQRDTG